PGRGPARGGAACRGGGGGRCGVSGGHQRALGAAGGGFVRRATVPLRSNQESLLRIMEVTSGLCTMDTHVRLTVGIRI
ncbi:Os08g0466050, partial [Oryza sativa Japonica Group]